MKDLKVLAPNEIMGIKHSHIAYINEETGAGTTSIDEQHIHELAWQPEVPEQMDEMGNVIAPAQPGMWIVQPATDGHTHDLTDYVVEPKKQKKAKDKDVVKEVYEYFRLGLETQTDSIEKGRKSIDYYYGKQWDEIDKNYLKQIDRAALTINLVQPKIDRLSGYERATRTDFKYLPQEGSDQRKADLYSIVAKHIQYRSKYKREKSKVFLDMAIPGRGAFNVYMDHSEDIFGECRIESFKWDDFLTGPFLKEDLSDCEWIIKHRMFSKEKLNSIAPKVVKKLDKVTDILQETFTDSKSTLRGKDNYEVTDSSFPVLIGDCKIADLARKDYRVIELWRRVYSLIPFAVNPNDEAVFDLSDWETDDLERVKTISGFMVIERPSNKIRITRIVGNQLISDENPADIPTAKFHLVPAYCYRNDEDFMGKVESAKDSQNQINHRASQLVDIGNKMAAYGWFYDSTTFPQGQEKKFQRISSKPGFMQKVTSTSKPPLQVEGVKFPTEVANLFESDMNILSAVMNVTVEEGGANQSGAHLLQKEKDKLGGNQFMFDALNEAQEQVAQLVLNIIQTKYSPERIYQLVSSSAAKDNPMVGDKPFSEYTREEIVEILSAPDPGKFDCVVTDATNSPTIRTTIFIMLNDLMQSGVPVPPELLVEYMDISDEAKQRLLESLAQQQQAQLEAQKATANAEIEKTLIAQGIMTPSAQQLLQGAPPVDGGYGNEMPPEQGGISQ